MSQFEKIKIILSGGGTGGHVFPAIAIASEIKQLYPKSEILFVGAKGKMEMEKVPSAGFEIKCLWISGFQRRLTWSNLLFPFKLVSSLLSAYLILRKFKPNLVVGTGGYASGPLLEIAVRMKIPIVIQEQNSFPGITNRILAPKASLICVAFPGLEKYFPASKVRVTGNPVRKDLLNVKAIRQQAFDYFNLDWQKPVLLVIGGSLGARTINEAICENLGFILSNGYQIIWQTGKAYYETVEYSVKEWAERGVVVVPFIARMDYAYSAADLVISRAGAISLSELAVLEKPSVLIPSPNVTDDHQTKNALAFQEIKGAVLLKDQDTKADFQSTLLPLLKSKELRDEMTQNLSKIAKPNAAQDIVKEILKLL